MTEVWLGASWPRRGPVSRLVRNWWAEGLLDGLELTLEHGFAADPDPEWAGGLDAAAARGRLLGHAVMPSPYTPPDAVHEGWFPRAQAVAERYRPRWVTDHEGLSRARAWQAAPLPLPPSDRLVQRVRDHLARLSDALQLPTVLENLALAASPDDARARPDLLHAMLQPDGVLLLDVHNLWCTAVNQRLDPVAYLRRFPLHLVRQLHVAGGARRPRRLPARHPRWSRPRGGLRPGGRGPRSLPGPGGGDLGAAHRRRPREPPCGGPAPAAAARPPTHGRRLCACAATADLPP